MADLEQIARKREAKRKRKALEMYLNRASHLDLPASCHRVLNALIIETVQKKRKETDELSKNDLRKLTKLSVPTQDRAIARLKKEGWLSSRRIANGGTVFTVTLPRKGSLFDLAGPKGKELKRPKRLRLKPKPQK